MRGDDLPVTAVAPVHAELVAHRRVEVIADGNPDKAGPGLPEVACRLLGELQVREHRWPKVVGVKLLRELALGKSLFVQRRRAHRAQSHSCDGALAGQGVACRLLQRLNPVGRLLVRERLNEHLRLGQFRFFHFESAKAEAGDSLWSLALPHADVLPTLVGFAD